jgi:hypothetical protein
MATDTGAILHVPPPAELLNVTLLPAQMGELPIIGPGVAFTVTTTLTAPQLLAYETVAVPVATPVTMPPEVIVATLDGAMAHVPPLTVLLSVIVLPAHMGTLPLIGPGAAPTVTMTVAAPQPVV